MNGERRFLKVTLSRAKSSLEKSKEWQSRSRLFGLQLAALTLILSLMLLDPSLGWAHGFVGKRFFPTTFAVEDPFVSDEFSALFNHIKEDPSTKTTSVGLDYSKRITPRLGISVGEQYLHLDIGGEDSVSGFGNLELGIKYQLFTNEERETILSLGIAAEIGGTGTRHIGAESFSIISPALLFGKGFGDLPESAKYLRPFAITGVIGPNIPTRSKDVIYDDNTGESEIERNPNTLTWGFALQYSLVYLQSFVKDVGLGDPFKRLVLIAEFPMETCLDRGCKGQTTGTVNPGLVWVGKTTQFGIAAQIPINDRSGENVGVFALFHLFLDDLFPKGIGRPIFP
jgi:hypothetical protein